MARLPQVSIKGNDVKISNIRNFDYRSETDFTPRYYSKHFNLDEIKTLDYILSYWDGNKAIAHIIFSFGFKNGDYLAVSVETRLAKEQEQSLLSGIFNQYTIIYILSDERDVVRLRTNFRKEKVYLYRVKIDPAQLRKIFVKIVRRAGDDVLITGYDNKMKYNPWSQFDNDFPFATVEKNNTDIGMTLVDILKKRIKNEYDANAVKIKLPGKIITF